MLEISIFHRVDTRRDDVSISVQTLYFEVIRLKSEIRVENLRGVGTSSEVAKLVKRKRKGVKPQLSDNSYTKSF